MVSRDAVQERARRSLFFIEFSGMANQCEKCLLYDVGCCFRPPCHVHGVSIYPALVPAVKLQKCAFVAGAKTPHEFDIPWFGYVWHLPRFDVWSPPAVTLSFLANSGKVPISCRVLVRRISAANRGLTPLATVYFNFR